MEGDTTMDISVKTIYDMRSLEREPISQSIINIISKLKISFKPAFRRPIKTNTKKEATEAEITNWRETLLAGYIATVREKDDADYEHIVGCINKIAKPTYTKLLGEILEKIEKRDQLFRLRATTLLFDRGIQFNCYSAMMADIYKEVITKFPDAHQDLLTQINMFDTLYDAKDEMIVIPSIEDAGYNNAIIAWTKKKEKKRSFANYLACLYERGLVPTETMNRFVDIICTDLKESVLQPRTPASEEHVDNLVAFLFGVAPKVAVGPQVKDVLDIPRPEAPSLGMKSRFKLQDTLKIALK
jgi:hypothetical protein